MSATPAMLGQTHFQKCLDLTGQAWVEWTNLVISYHIFDKSLCVFQAFKITLKSTREA